MLCNTSISSSEIPLLQLFGFPGFSSAFLALQAAVAYNNKDFLGRKKVCLKLWMTSRTLLSFLHLLTTCPTITLRIQALQSLFTLRSLRINRSELIIWRSFLCFRNDPQKPSTPYLFDTKRAFMKQRYCTLLFVVVFVSKICLNLLHNISS